MRRVTVTIDDETERLLDGYLQQQDAVPTLTTIVQAALKKYLERRGGPRRRENSRSLPRSKVAERLALARGMITHDHNLTE